MMRPLIILAVWMAAAMPGPVRAQEAESERDRALEEMEARLQEQRAIALRSRLVLYTDELEKLHAQFKAAGDTTSADAAKSELDAAQFAMRQLANIARRQADPPAPGELQKDEQLSGAALAARRINKIMERFSVAKTTVRPAAGGSSSPNPVLNLKFEKAVRNRDYSESSSRGYWAYENAYALWSITNMAPGEYEVILRFNADAETGGKAVVKVGGMKFDVEVPKGTKGAKEQKKTAGTVSIKESGVDVRVENGGLAPKAASLWDLESVVLQPVAKRP